MLHLSENYKKEGEALYSAFMELYPEESIFGDKFKEYIKEHASEELLKEDEEIKELLDNLPEDTLI